MLKRLLCLLPLLILVAGCEGTPPGDCVGPDCDDPDEPTCGDGVAEEAEACDGDDLRGATCADQGFTSGLLSCDSQCRIATTGCDDCGNGAVDPGEACDGNALAGQDCVTLGYDGGTLACAGACAFDLSACTGAGPICGDHQATGLELCDGADRGGIDCVTLGFDGGTPVCNGSCNGFDTTNCWRAPSCTDVCAEGAVACDAEAAVFCSSLGACLGWQVVDACAGDRECRDGECISTTCEAGTVLPCTERGICSGGERSCAGGTWSTCDWQIGPELESCDGLDNDCDGAADNGLPAANCPLQTGVCDGAGQRCDASQLAMVCDAEAYAAEAARSGWGYEDGEETRCDGLDNDCDGATDETATCAGGAACLDGACVCPPGSHRCGDTCVDNDDPATCGARCDPCPEPTGGAATCDGASCGIACDAGFHGCGGACVSNDALESCGASCTPCPTDPYGTVSCDGVTCQVACDAGFHDCSGTCVANDASAHCGSRCTPCPTDPNGIVSCDGFDCVLACDAGFHACGDACVPNDSVATCGDRCAPCPTSTDGTTSCDGVNCQLICDANYHRCGDNCLYDDSTESCGSACSPCPEPSGGYATCDGSACGIACDFGYHDCGGWCASDLSTNSCGSSCTPCPAGPHGTATCDGVSCDVVCDAGYLECQQGCCDWSSTTIATGGNYFGRHTSIAVDSSGNPHIAFYDGPAGDLALASWNGSSWSFQAVASQTAGGTRGIALAIDPFDQFHIGYFNGGLRYASGDGSTWNNESVEGTSSLGFWIAIAADAAGTPHLTYREPNAAVVRYATESGGTWSIETVDANDGWEPDITLDTAGYPHLTYARSGLRYARWSGSQWNLEHAGSTGGSHSTVVLDSAGRPHVIHMDVANNDTYYSHWNGSSWQETFLDTEGGSHTAMVLDRDDNPLAFYYCYFGGPLKTGHLDGTWSIEVFDSRSFAGGYVSMAKDAYGDPHVAYFHDDGTNEQFIYVNLTP